jgi:tetratricopeptide (TPR) repeat protein
MLAMDQEAREHFQLGRTFYDAGRFQQAAEEFEAAYRLSGRPQLLYNLYVAHRDAGELDQAIVSLRAYLEKVPDAPDRVNLKARLQSLEQQAQKHAEQEARAQQATQAGRTGAPPKTRTETKRSVVPWVLLGTGGGLLVGSIATGVMAQSKAKDLDGACGDSDCPASQKSNIDTTRTLAITTDVLWSVGGACAVTGLVLWLTGALDEERQVPVAMGFSRAAFSTTYSRRF